MTDEVDENDMLECFACEADNDWVGHLIGCSRETPMWQKACGDCLQTVERWRGQGDVTCECGAEYNTFGKRRGLPMLHEMSEAMEQLLRDVMNDLESAKEKITESIPDLKSQEPLDEDLDGVDPAWEGTWDQGVLEDRMSFLQDAETQLENAIRAIEDSIEV